jgi:NADH-quinone oxidoreductase subunit F
VKEERYLKELIEADTAQWEYKFLQKAFELGREESFAQLEKSELVGRGGAGFPTPVKWSFVADKEDVILICNADEGEPGTFKDRFIMENNPHLLLEGILISAFILQAKEAYIYIRGEYKNSIANLKNAVEDSEKILEWYRQNINGTFTINVVEGAGAYICGDETSLINSIEGTRPASRMKPPYPAQEGLFNEPTIVNNVETLTNLPFIIRDGGEKYAKRGVEKSRGTKLISISGKVNDPGVYEVEMGKVTMKELIFDIAGGIKNGNKIKFVIPGGVSTQVLTSEELDVPLDYESLKEAGSSLGSGAVIVADETVDVVEMACETADFFREETCGTCFPCREGNRQMHHLLSKIHEGKGDRKYFKLIEKISKATSYSARCGLGESAGNLVGSSIEKLKGEYLQYL